MAGHFAAFVAGSLTACAFFSDERWRIPRRPYVIVLAAILYAGIILDWAWK